MAQDYSFDVVSQFDRQELVNAVNQAQREIVTRYDFKDTGASIDLGEDEITLNGPSEFKLKAMIDVLQSKLVKRQLSLKILKAGPIETAAKGNVRQTLLQQAQLGVVQTTGNFLAVARDERHGGTAVEQIHGRPHLFGPGDDIVGDALFDAEHGRLLFLATACCAE